MMAFYCYNVLILNDKLYQLLGRFMNKSDWHGFSFLYIRLKCVL